MYAFGLQSGSPKGTLEVSVGIIYSCNAGTPSSLTLGSHTEDTIGAYIVAAKSFLIPRAVWQVGVSQ